MKVYITATKMGSIVPDYKRIADSLGFDVVDSIKGADFIHLNYPISKAGLKVLLSNKPLLLHFHGSDTRPKKPHHLWLLNELIKKSQVACYTTPDLIYPLDYLYPDDKPLFYVPFPVDTNFFRPFKADHERQNRFLIAGELHKIKHWEKRFEEYNEYAHLIDVIDYGVDRDYYKKFIDDVVTWLSRRSFEAMPSLYNNYRFIIPQASIAFEYFGSMGRVEAEALACGCKLVYVEGGRVKEYKYTRQYVLDNFSFDAVSKKLKKAYESMSI